jgi:hypothetical protein
MKKYPEVGVVLWIFILFLIAMIFSIVIQKAYSPVVGYQQNPWLGEYLAILFICWLISSRILISYCFNSKNLIFPLLFGLVIPNELWFLESGVTGFPWYISQVNFSNIAGIIFLMAPTTILGMCLAYCAYRKNKPMSIFLSILCVLYIIFFNVLMCWV